MTTSRRNPLNLPPHELWLRLSGSVERRARYVRLRVFLMIAVFPLTFFSMDALSFAISLLLIIVSLVWLVRNRQLFPEPESVAPPEHIVSMVRSLEKEVVSQLKIDDFSETEVRMLSDRFDINAHVSEHTKNRSTVYFTLGYVVAFRKNPEKFRAIAAHELGHVVAKDISIWRFLVRWRIYMIEVLLPWTILKFLALLIVYSGIDTINFVVLVLSTALPFAFVQGMSAVRAESEKNADYVAALATSAKSVLLALEDIRSHTGGLLSIHPSTVDRMECIEDIFDDQAFSNR